MARCLKQENLQSLKWLLSSYTWENVLQSTNAEDAFDSFNTSVRLALEATCPMKKIKTQVKKKPKQFADQEAIRLKDEYLRELRKFEDTGNFEHKQQYRETKKNYDLRLKMLKNQAASHHMQNAQNKSKAMWNLINNTWSRQETETNEISLEIKGKQVGSPKDVAEYLNTFFASIAVETLNKNNGVYNRKPLQDVQLTGPQLLTLKETNEKEINKIIKSLKTKNSAGLDEISSKILKFCSNELTPPLVNIINKSLKHGHFPSKLKISKVYPKFKKGNTADASNYRPISLLSTFSKVCERVVIERLLKHCTQHSLLTDSQHGFIKGKSTTSAMVKMIETIIDSIENGRLTSGVFLDLSKAFDCLDHSLIVKKLEQLGVRGTAKQWFQSYLEGRSQLVELSHIENGITKVTKSNLQPIHRGVPQGSVLGPALFILFVNDLPKYLGDSCQTLSYADDTTLLLSETTTERMAITSYISVNMAYEYCHNNDLAVNQSKTTQIGFGRRSDEVPHIPEVEMSNETKFLGIILDKNLSWTPHIDMLCKKLASSIYAMKQIKATTDDATTRTAYFALFEPHMRYGLLVWGGTSATNLQRVLRQQKKAIRILAGLQRLESCREAFKSLKILTTVALYIQEATLHAVKESPPTRHELQPYNLRHNIYDLPAHRLTQYEKKPTYIGSKLHNLLPHDLRIKNKKELKPALHKWLIDRPYYSMEEFFQQTFDNGHTGQ